MTIRRAHRDARRSGADLSFFEDQPERVLEIAIRAFGKAKARAIAENDCLGIPIRRREAGRYGVCTRPVCRCHPYQGTAERGQRLRR
jgi:hypothetical protein